jgi:hypothetical protein
MDERKTGFMIGMGLLLNNSSSDFKTELKGILNGFGSNLHLEIEDEEHATTADNERVNPCPPGYAWDQTQGQCVVLSDP